MKVIIPTTTPVFKHKELVCLFLKTQDDSFKVEYPFLKEEEIEKEVLEILSFNNEEILKLEEGYISSQFVIRIFTKDKE